jgi:diketogulonate reductase-like aldo/keto reductase
LVLERFYREGKFKAIGVSNYTAAHLEEMKGYATIMPCVNQVEFHPMQTQTSLTDIHRAMGIQLVAYSSLGE